MTLPPPEAHPLPAHWIHHPPQCVTIEPKLWHYLKPQGMYFSAAGPFVYPETRVETHPLITISGDEVLKVDI